MTLRKDKVLVLGLFLLAVAAGAGFQLLRGGGGVPATPTGGPPAKPSAVVEFRGISLQLHTNDPACPFEQYIEEIAQTGANTVSFVVSAYQEHGGSTSIFIDQRRTPPVERILALCDLAHRKGLRVIIIPLVLLENPRQNEWRGKISPANANWSDWWEDYTNYIVHYAEIARAGKAEVFMVGSELNSTETQTERWQGLIAQVRRIYPGRLSYSANWDHYHVISWWSDLDIVGMTTYFDLTGGDEPTVERLSKSWRAIKKEILDWQRKVDRPILFTEVGWPNQVTCAQYPWDYYRAKDQPDQDAQANCFEAFFRAWIDEKAVAGFLVYEWRNHPDQKLGPEDTSYSPCGKKAMQVIREYFQRPSAWGRPAEATPASAPAAEQPASSPAAVKTLGLRKDDLFFGRDVALTDEQAANLALQCKLKTI